MKNFLVVETSEGLMDIFVARPDTTEKLPLVIVLQEAFGVNHHIQSICERLAAEGFIAAAPDLYHREGRKITVDYNDREAMMPYLKKLSNEGIIKDVRETINFLDDYLPNIDTQNSSCIGFCVGGLGAALVATKLNVKKMVAFYGGGIVRPREGFALRPIIDELHLIKAQSLFFFGGIDASIPETDVKAIEEKLKTSKVKHQVMVYPEADHGFFCDERKSFNAEAAEDAWKRTLTHLK